MKLKIGNVVEGDELIIDNKKIGTIISIANSNIFAKLNINSVNDLRKSNQSIVINDSLALDFLN